MNGYTVTKMYQGEVVHEEVRFNEQLVMHLLASRDPYRYGRNPNLGRLEVQREAAAESLEKAMALIDTELVSTGGRLSLADARDALEGRLKREEQEEAAADRKARALREREEMRASLAECMNEEQIERILAGPNGPSGSWPAEAAEQGREVCELTPAPPAPEAPPPVPIRRRKPSVRRI